ncbi:MAG: ABC transporter permease [Myxococcota bacterium]|nr:ABC transporter permease [Myxococcota bacterium]
MRRIAALVRKELEQHAGALLGLASFLAGSWALLMLGVFAAPATVTYLEAHANMLRFFVPVAGLALGNRLVVAEYHGRTQLFLEALPLGRFEMLFVKLGLGLVLMEGIALGSLGATLLVASTREPVDLPFVAILAARTSVVALALWCFFFAMGLLGRLRIPIYIAIVMLLLYIASATELELMRFGPFRLLAEDLALERTRWPTEALLVTLAIAAGWVALAMVLAAVREGSIAETLSQRMSQREKVSIGMVFFIAVVAWGRLAPPTERPPLEFPEDGVARSSTLPIEVMYVDEEARDDAEALLARLEPELAALREGLGWDELPPVRVALAERLDGRTFEPVTVGEDDGVLLRANFLRGPEFNEDELVSEIVGRTIDAATGGRALWEPIEWPRDGIAAWWPHRDEVTLPDALVLRALWATRARPIDPPRLHAWDRTLQRDGERVSAALAATGIQVLEDTRGKDAVLALGRALFGRELPDDGRAVIHGWLNPTPEVLREATGMTEGELIDAWSRWLETAEARSDLETSIRALPYGEAAVSFVRASEGELPELVARLTLDRAPAPGTTVSLLHLGIGPFDEYVWPWEPQREERAWPCDGEVCERTIEIRLPGRYGPGQRAWVSLDVEGTVLGTAARAAHARLEAE